MKTSEILVQVAADLVAGRRIRQDLPGGGFLHVDRAMPFLFIYRPRPGSWDEGTASLLHGTSEFFITPGARGQKITHSLLKLLASHAVEKFGACLLLELSSVPVKLDAPSSAGFDIMIRTRHEFPLPNVVEELKMRLERLTVRRRRAQVKLFLERRVAPTDLPPLRSFLPPRSSNVHIISLEISDVFRDNETHTLYPLVLRKIHRTVVRALNRTSFTFCVRHTSQRPTSHYALGPRALVRSVWTVDRRLAGINNAFDLLLAVTPINMERAWNQFRKRRFEQAPQFIYRPLEVDPSELKHELFRIDLSKLEDPGIARLMRQKQTELDRQVSLLRDRNTPAFIHNSQSLFGNIEPELVTVAEELCRMIPPRARDTAESTMLNANQVAEAARASIRSYQKMAPDLTAKVQVRDDIAGILVSRGNLLIGSNTRIAEKRIEELLEHEIGVHVGTYYNGGTQRFSLFQCGLPNYDELQEGVAVLMEHLRGCLSRPRLRLLGARVLAAQAMVNGASFIETFRRLNDELEFEQRAAFLVTARIYRGGGYTKDMIYLRGFIKVLEYLHKGGDLEPLFVGKISFRSLELVKELMHRQVVLPPALLPLTLQLPEAQKRLAEIRAGITVLDLAKQTKKQRKTST